ncbi:MAG: DUF177 domain-containing protein [Dongiaceae bacterium]
MTKSAAPPAEFSRPVAADQIGPQETEREIVANEVERARLAERFGLLALDRLAATLQLRRSRSGVIRVTGRFEAEVVQACVVTLEPVPARVSESFAAAFGPSPAAPAGEVVIVDLDEEDPAEELVDGRIDLGEVVAQQLAVALDPYPRAPGADDRFSTADGEGADGDAKAGPFAALERLRERRS